MQDARETGVGASEAPGSAAFCAPEQVAGLAPLQAVRTANVAAADTCARDLARAGAANVARGQLRALDLTSGSDLDVAATDRVAANVAVTLAAEAAGVGARARERAAVAAGGLAARCVAAVELTAVPAADLADVGACADRLAAVALAVERTHRALATRATWTATRRLVAVAVAADYRQCSEHRQHPERRKRHGAIEARPPRIGSRVLLAWRRSEADVVRAKTSSLRLARSTLLRFRPRFGARLKPATGPFRASDAHG